MTDLDQAKTDSKITRRTVAKGAAWTLPVVSLAAAAPAEAASVPPKPCTSCLTPQQGSIIWAPLPVLSTISITTGLTSTCANLVFLIGSLGKGTITFTDGSSQSGLAVGVGGGLGPIGAFEILTTVGNGYTGFPPKALVPDTLCIPFTLSISLFGKPAGSCERTICYKISKGIGKPIV